MLFCSHNRKQHRSVCVFIVCHFLSSLSWRQKWRVSWFYDFIARFSQETTTPIKVGQHYRSSDSCFTSTRFCAVAAGWCLCNNRRGKQVSEGDRPDVDWEDDEDVCEAVGVPASEEPESTVCHSTLCRTSAWQSLLFLTLSLDCENLLLVNVVYVRICLLLWVIFCVVSVLDFFALDFRCQYQCKWLPGKTRPQNNL